MSCLCRALQFDTDLFRKPQRHMLAPRWLAVKVGVVDVVGNALQNRFAQFLVVWDSREGQSNWSAGRCRYRQRQSTIAGEAADQQRRRAADRRQRNLAERRTQ